MAKIEQCRYCERTVVNAHWHKECRLAFCEGLLRKIQKHSKRYPRKPLPNAIAKEMDNEIFDSLDDLFKRDNESSRRAHAKRLHELAKTSAVQSFVSNWESQHPDPDPRTY